MHNISQWSIQNISDHFLEKGEIKAQTPQKAPKKEKKGEPRKVCVILGSKLMFSFLLLEHVFKFLRTWMEMITFLYWARDNFATQPAAATSSYMEAP